ncbi:sphingosine-1-phosphate lyase 1-like [Ptychodera flava]|uniref:sphingosine-1-phosphate lyase 1-like n=1 Tax=Ptychodera flava TaxID=63121 RepID=UPI00396A3177
MAATSGEQIAGKEGILSLVKTKLEPMIEVGTLYLNKAKDEINSYCSGMEAWQIVLYTLGLTLVVVWLYRFLFDHELGLFERIQKSFFKNVRHLPIIGTKIKQEIEKTCNNVENFSFKLEPGQTYVTNLPYTGLSESKLLQLINDKYETMEGADWTCGKVSGTVYNGNAELTSLITKVYGQYAWANPLHPDVFPGVRKMEAEVVAMTCKMFNGGPEACGTMTSGGTESILMACRVYRHIAYERGVKYPEILAPKSVHSAFNKAADYFRMKVVLVPLDPVTMKCDVKAMARMINRNTCMLVGSAPQFPHGTLDPIEEMSKLALKHKLPLHVDSCLGGFLVPFMKKAGYHIEPFDFSLPGVTSISADTHKYGFTPKGSSVIMYSNKSLRFKQYYINPDWQGGIYASPAIAGSRAGALIAATWAVMMHYGEQGYVDSTRAIIQTTRHIEAGVRKIPGVYVVGQPDVSVVALGSLDFNVFQLASDLNKRGWNLNSLQFPSCFHICVTIPHTKNGVADVFLKDVQECSEALLSQPRTKADGMAAIYGTAQAIPDRSIVSEAAGAFLDACYKTNYQTVANGVDAK